MAKKKNQIRREDVLEYHEGGRPGKIEVIPSKPSNSQRDLSIAYSPGVAEPCKEIEKDPETAYKYTAKGNLVAVISNGTAVLGLGDIGPLASKPVMEGKGVLFKIFADIDTFDLELDANDPELFIQTVKALAPTFGGINLEDIKAPECFEIEQRLKEELDIPIMHDDQHGTAIISGAGLLNALTIVEKDIDKVRVVFNGAGASAVSCASLYLSLGVKAENLLMLDSKGVITTDRENLTPEKKRFARDTKLNTLEEAVEGADVFVGLSRGGVLSKKMVKSMAADPIVFALANPDPEITYEEAVAARKDVVMATGRSDNPNQVNNVLGFPFIFRGALDVRASKINEEMKLAATYAIANLAKEAVPEIVNLAYGQKNMSFGKDYIIPKPFDPRLIYTVAMAVAKAAMDSGVAKNPITNWARYKEELITRLGRDDKFIRLAMEKARANPQRVVFSEADNFKMLKAAQIAYDEGIAIPILLGDEKRIKQIDKQYDLGIAGTMEIVDPRSMPDAAEVYAQQFYEERKRKGVTEFEARRLMKNRDYFGPMMVKHGDADAFITGLTIKYPRAVRPLLEILGPKDHKKRVAGMYIMLTKRGPIFFADTTINEEPDAEGIVDIVLSVARTVSRINLKPKVALLSYSNFGSHHGKVPTKMNKAVELLKQSHPDLIVDGEMQANFAVNNELLEEVFPFSDLVNHKPNIFIFPDLAAGNISYKLLQSLGAAEAIGPILIGLDKAAHVLQMGASVREIVNIVAMAVVDAQTRSENH
ncbi:NADP-dependent malic enzyme [Phaeocystidibacter marisrubri]|uniref:NADP-dependent malic enzyme n=1 Tax=Phaeocystidibacter marisrubri TaxID=1577780 RepID=A0A6L3ZES1_9FLAO|nr:NADP-dependent malic enzyme [Phaeocystidibacter marisrubri]KAB2816116.1 NADP-dependent malic enzyme [Phaeocystidibacter marisrubri]GGH67411.1 malic enzyme [Phaeocystidibacter marisrubri]